jgi:hypothetical protein
MLIPVRAMSVKQPWASLIAKGQKTIETRTWATKYRGDLLIVSSKSPRIQPAGFALALARLVECRPMTPQDETAACCGVYPHAFAWVLKDVKSVAPFPVHGRLGIYTLYIESDMLVPAGIFDLHQVERL